MTAIALVETGGNDFKVGKDGELGRLQTKKIVVDDIYRIYGIKYNHRSCTDYHVSQIIFYLYINYYLTKNKLPFTVENIALLWNGGPDMDGSKQYVKKVKKKYKELVESS